MKWHLSEGHFYGTIKGYSPPKMKFISSADFSFPQRKGIFAGEMAQQRMADQIKFGEVAEKDQAKKSTGEALLGLGGAIEKVNNLTEGNGRIGVMKEYNRLDEVLEKADPNLEIELLRNLAKNEGKFDDEKTENGSPWERFKSSLPYVETDTTEERVGRILKELSNEALESFIYTYPEDAQELFTDKLEGGEYRVHFYDNAYLNQHVPLESLFTYKEKFIKKGFDTAVWTPEGYMIIDKDGNETTERLTINDKQRVRVLDTEQQKNLYPQYKYVSEKHDEKMDLNRRANFSCLQIFKFNVTALTESGKLDSEQVSKLGVLRQKSEEITRSDDAVQYMNNMEGIIDDVFQVLGNNDELIDIWGTSLENIGKINDSVLGASTDLMKEEQVLSQKAGKSVSSETKSENKFLSIRADMLNYYRTYSLKAKLELKGVADQMSLREEQEGIMVLCESEPIRSAIVQVIGEGGDLKAMPINDLILILEEIKGTLSNREDIQGAITRYKEIEYGIVNDIEFRGKFTDTLTSTQNNIKKQLVVKFNSLEEYAQEMALSKKKAAQEELYEMKEYINAILEAPGLTEKSRGLVKEAFSMAMEFPLGEMPEPEAYKDLGKKISHVQSSLRTDLENMDEGPEKERIQELYDHLLVIVSLENVAKQEQANTAELTVYEKKIEGFLGKDLSVEFLLLLGQDDLGKAEALWKKAIANPSEELKKALKADPQLFYSLLKEHGDIQGKIGRARFDRGLFERNAYVQENIQIIHGANKLLDELKSSDPDFIKFCEEEYDLESFRLLGLLDNEKIPNLEAAVVAYSKAHRYNHRVYKLKAYLQKNETQVFFREMRRLDGKVESAQVQYEKGIEFAEILDKSDSFDEFKKNYKEKKKEYASKAFQFSNPEVDLESVQAQQSIASAAEVSMKFPNFTIESFNKEGLPVYSVGEPAQEIVADIEAHEMYPNNIDLSGTMADRLKFPLEAEHVPGVQLTGAITDGNFWTSDYGLTNDTRRIGQGKFQNMIAEIYNWGAHRELTENEINGWKNLQIELRARGKGMQYLWSVMGAIDKNGEVIDEKGKDIRMPVMKLIDSARVGNFEVLDRYEASKEQLVA